MGHIIAKNRGHRRVLFPQLQEQGWSSGCQLASCGDPEANAVEQGAARVVEVSSAILSAAGELKPYYAIHLSAPIGYTLLCNYLWLHVVKSLPFPECCNETTFGY